MGAFFKSLLDPQGLTPHGFCLLWEPGLLWLNAGADSVISLAYFSIPLALLTLLRRRRDMAFSRVFLLFAAFITACGTTHLLEVLTLWVPAYRLEGGVKLITAGLSVATAIALWPLIPRAVALPSQATLMRANQELADRVTELDRTSRLLGDSEARARISINTPAHLFILDRDGRLAGVSDRWLELLGATSTTALGRPIHGFLAPDTAAHFDFAWNEALQGRDVRDSEQRLRTAAGQNLAVLVSLRPEQEPDGTVHRVLGSLTDITARRQAEQDLHTALERLRRIERMEAIGNLTGGIAHDFNNLLAIVVTNLDMLADETNLSADARAMAVQARTAAMHGAALIGQLLAFARRLPLEPRSVDLAALSAGIVKLLDRALGETVHLSLSSAEGLWPVTADPGQLENAILNLAINARDAMTKGGTLHLRTENVTLTEADIADLADAAPGDHVMISVADTGIGMTPETLARVFEPFFTTKAEGQGTGLGLSMVDGFTRQSGGHVRIASVFGAGTTVSLFLPRSHTQPEPPKPHQSLAGPLPRGTETVLVVDDNEAVRHSTRRVLEYLGYTVLEAADGAAALSLLERTAEIDLLFTDVVMPGGMSGIAMADMALELHPGLCVLFTSGYAVDVGTGASMVPQQHDLLSKPYRRSDLARRVRAALDPPAERQA